MPVTANANDIPGTKELTNLSAGELQEPLVNPPSAGPCGTSHSGQVSYCPSRWSAVAGRVRRADVQECTAAQL